MKELFKERYGNPKDKAEANKYLNGPCVRTDPLHCEGVFCFPFVNVYRTFINIYNIYVILLPKYLHGNIYVTIFT